MHGKISLNFKNAKTLDTWYLLDTRGSTHFSTLIPIHSDLQSICVLKFHIATSVSHFLFILVKKIIL